VTIADWGAGGSARCRRVGTERSIQRLTQLLRLYEDSRLRIEVASAFPLSAAAAAHRLVETGHVRGKVALVVE
jgi:enoyl reductase